MNVSLYQAVAAMNANARWQEVVADNLACSSIPGYKRQDISFEALHSGLTAPSAGRTTPSGLMSHASMYVNFTQGEVRPTGVNTDLAIDGRGFFTVQLPDGQTGYTRDGEFRLSSSGELVTKQGYPVLSDTGTIRVDQNLPGPLTFSASGEVSQGGELRGRLKIVDFEKPALLTQIQGGTFLAMNPELEPQDMASPSVMQGFLESSNTSPSLEMASLMEAMRAFEAGQRLLRLEDERMGQVISELGSPS